MDNSGPEDDPREDIDRARRKLLKLAVYAPPAVVGSLATLSGCQAAPSCGPSTCPPEDDDNCTPGTCGPETV